MASQGSVNVSEVAEHLGVNPSTASRILTTIEADGFAIRGERRRYFLGARALHFGRTPELPALDARLRRIWNGSRVWSTKPYMWPNWLAPPCTTAMPSQPPTMRWC